eukprot:CAMPEP_0197037014 /NCGR_PEP_ID=MMETSP1384-20130603/14333_1 /TAXON_ID=29189 /ORGANISM="Ammonia sp." /LENGTH=319 /DNA_ID=CAMNT_0042467261 /DNA_START=73 /DNA_END=1035 /DNA_ORIENTATION=+
MSNIRGFGDVRNDPMPNPNAQRYQQAQQAQQTNPQQQGQSPFMMGAGGGGAGGSMYPPINKVLAPNFTPKSFIFIISMIQIAVFVMELIVGQIWFCGAFVTGNDMAGPSSECLKWMGGKYLPCIQNGEVYRFFTPALLHAGILHIFTNLVSQTMIGYTCELHWGLWRMAGFYFATAFGATLLSCVGSPGSISVGASGALLGIIGAYMVWILLNWNNRDILPQPCPRMCTMITWLFIIFMIGISMTGIDNLAHLGGWLSGILLGFAFNTATMPISWLENRIKCIQITFAVLSIAYFIVLLAVTFFVVDSGGECWGDLPTC